ncbi:rhomboid-like protein [Streptomyces sp. NPDC006879]|uniref:rhomboid-like protein n=1 Tax=Streptomyces sp. NPDC006879 TaxID=3364767 RepID=UPI00369B95EB
MTQQPPVEPEPSRPVRSWVCSSPGTHIWFLIIALTSLVVLLAPSHLDHLLLHRNSSNLHQLLQHPVQSLVSSAFWIEDPMSLPLYLVLFEVFLAPVERWLGTLRWLVIVVMAHVTATLISQRLVLESIETHRAPAAMAHVLDIGVSYGIAGAVGVLAYRLLGPWRWLYLVSVLAVFGVPLANDGSFTDLGHVIALGVGLTALPLTRGLPGERPGAGGPDRTRTGAAGENRW